MNGQHSEYRVLLVVFHVFMLEPHSLIFGPLIVYAPSYPWHRLANGRPRFPVVVVIAVAISTALTLSNFRNAINSSRILQSLSMKQRHLGKCSVL